MSPLQKVCVTGMAARSRVLVITQRRTDSQIRRTGSSGKNIDLFSLL
jgi:hypothetical protein